MCLHRISDKQLKMKCHEYTSISMGLDFEGNHCCSECYCRCNRRSGDGCLKKKDFLLGRGWSLCVNVEPERKAVYHLPVVFGTLFFLPLEYPFTVYIAKLVMVADRDRNCIHPFISPSYRIRSRQCMIKPAMHISHFQFILRTIAINDDDVSAKFLSIVNRRQVI